MHIDIRLNIDFDDPSCGDCPGFGVYAIRSVTATGIPGEVQERGQESDILDPFWDDHGENIIEAIAEAISDPGKDIQVHGV